MKHYIYILLVFFFGYSQMATSQQGTTIDRVIAKVGSEYVLYSDLLAAYRYQKEQNPAYSQEEICPLFEQIVAQKLLVHQAKLDSIIVSNEEIENAIDYRMDNILRMMGGDESQFETYYNKTVTEAKDGMRDDMKQQMLAERIQQSLISEVNITPKEVVEFYNLIPQDSLPYLSSEVEIAEIVMKPKVNDVEKEKSRTKLLEIYNDIIEGEVGTFEAMAAKYSADGSAESGGNLGWQKRGTFVPEFEAVAYSLDKDEISEPVETEFGFHIIRLNDRRGNLINCSHILITPEITQADLDKTKMALDSTRLLMVRDSLDFSKSVKLFSDKKSDSYNNNGRMTNQKTGNTFFETGDLPPTVYFEIEELEVGEISEPIEFYDPRGNTQYRILKLLSRTKPHRASLEQDYSRIQLFAKESKKNEYYNKWIVEKMDETYIEVDPEFGQCENLSRWISEPTQTEEKP